MLNSKKLLAAAAASLMVVNAINVPAFAYETENNGTTLTSTTIDITKNIQKENTLNAPKVSFDFKVEPYTGATKKVNDAANPSKQFVVYSSPAGGLTATSSSTTNTGVENPDKTVATYSGAQLTINPKAFTAPGTYEYVVSEVIPTNIPENDAREGITYDDSSYSVFVVVENGTNNNLNVTGVVLAKSVTTNGVQTLTEKPEEIAFNNTYKTEDGDPEKGQLHNVIVTKTVEGNQGATNGVFNFKVKASGASGESYKIKASDGKEYSVSPDSELEIPLQVSNGKGTFTIYGLSKTDGYSVVEDTVYETEQGYTVTYSGAAHTGTDDATIQIGTANKEIGVRNFKDGNIPTGIIMSAAPFAGMIGLGGIFAGLFFRKKRED